MFNQAWTDEQIIDMLKLKETFIKNLNHLIFVMIKERKNKFSLLRKFEIAEKSQHIGKLEIT
jgi:hypothetical protein